jgi:hypothetical protein
MKRLLAPIALLAASCATLPEPVAGGDNLPNAGEGPFRALVMGELSATLNLSPPYGLDDLNHYAHDIAVLRVGEGDSLEVVAYVAAAGGSFPPPKTPTSTIVRYGAHDARSFDYVHPSVVLSADTPWEGGVIGSPAAVRAGGTVLLWYSAAGGIGLAKSTDGTSFTKVPGPVLTPANGTWERGSVPARPGVVALDDHSFLMFYEVAMGPGVTAIGEASSPDGESWTRVGSGPALTASGESGAWDEASVGSPFPILATSADGRPILRVYHGALDATGAGTIGVAGRYSPGRTTGALQRAVGPVFGTGSTLKPREPCVVPFAPATLLYVTEVDSPLFGNPSIAVGVAPATAVLPSPNPM